MTALLLLLALWVGSAVLIVPYLLHVANVELERAALHSQKPMVLRAEHGARPLHEASAVLLQSADTSAQVGERAKVMVKA